MLSAEARSWQKNVTCESSIDTELFLHYSLIPSCAIILVLSFLERRVNRRPIDENLHLLHGRFGIVIPLDFVGTFTNRWSFGFAFGATANKVMFLFSEGYLSWHVPKWAQAIVLLVGGIEVGLSYFPLFACLSTDFQVVGSVLGFSYTFIWFVVTVACIVQCPHGQVVGEYEKIVFYWPSLLCLVFLLGRFVHMFVKGMRVHLHQEAPREDKHFLEAHLAQHVKQLLQKLPQQQAQKSWFQRKVYEWDPCFQFPGRMICTSVLSLICLYIFIIIEFYIYKHVSHELEILEGSFEELGASINISEALKPAVLQMKELINVTQDAWIFTIFSALLTCVSYVFHILACYRKHMKRLWAGKKDFLPLMSRHPSSSQSVHVLSNQYLELGINQWDHCDYALLLPALFREKHLRSGVRKVALQVIHTAAFEVCYGKHCNLVLNAEGGSLFSKANRNGILDSAKQMAATGWVPQWLFGECGFSFHPFVCAMTERPAAIARYSGWQIAYILWGYLIIHVVQCLFGVLIAYSFVLPIKHGHGLEMLKGLGIGTLTIGIVVGFMILQIQIAASFFLQPKIRPEDKQKPLALNNRKAFHNFNYFLFFYNVLLGLGACLFRLLCSCILGTWLIARIDRTIMQKGYEAVDMGFKTWIGMIFMDHHHTNPTLLSFCHILLARNAEKKLRQSTKYRYFNNTSESKVSNTTKTRWLLLYTLLNNSQLADLRKHKLQSGSRNTSQNCRT